MFMVPVPSFNPSSFRSANVGAMKIMNNDVL